MTSIVLFSTLSFTVQKHICAGEVADVAIFLDVKSCDMPEDNHNNNQFGFEKKSCCQDEVHFVQGSNTELKISTKLKAQTKTFVALFTYTYLNLFENLEEDSNSFLSYYPPIILKDIPVLYETFLI